ncbi:MAG: SH3 domain-containing protein [Anaerolineae bacterium]|jgi:hypothetical protein|nr:SH3 domain-containing protein [Anaerolineae bacterium]
MKQLMLLIILGMLLLAPIQAQVLPPPEDPIVTPINGVLVMGTQEGFILLNTWDGTRQLIAKDIGGPVWDRTGTRLATETADDGFSIFEISQIAEDSNSHQRQISQPRIFTADRQVFYHQIAGWSSDSRYIMVRGSASEGITSNYAYRHWYLDILDTETGELRRILEIPKQTPMESVFYVPSDRVNILLDSIHNAHWNPIYPEWVFVQPIGYGNDAVTGEEAGWFDAGMYNYVTREFISFVTLFPQTVISTTNWSPDGTKLAMNTMTGITVIRFTIENNLPVLRVIADGVDSQRQAVLRWAGSGDILLTGIPEPYPTSFVTHIIDNTWYSKEFVAFDSIERGAGGYVALSIDPNEINRVSCLFFDTIYPSRLSPNTRGQVTFTDGTPSRLRSEPGLHPESSVVTQMQEGTSFEVSGDARCVDGYRWWPLRLADGTTGWAAEGTSDETWLEQIP